MPQSSGLPIIFGEYPAQVAQDSGAEALNKDKNPPPQPTSSLLVVGPFL
jgi:hypothetical protein